MKRTILELKNLSVTYYGQQRTVKALDEVSFSINEGEILGLVGESGSGKSTCAYSVLDLLPKDAKREGQIRYDGQNISSLSQAQMQKLRAVSISLIMQDPASSFNPVLSIGYQFKEFLEQNKNSNNNIQDIIKNSFKKVYLQDHQRILKSYPHQLSGGQLQRVALAMAISLGPRLLIADEPTSSLDVTIESQIVNLLKELNKTLGLTVLFITHNLDLVKVLCDRVVVLQEGKVKEINNTQDIFNKPQDEYTKKLVTAFKRLEE